MYILGYQFSRSSSDDDDTTSSVFLGDVNEDMCRGLPYTSLGCASKVCSYSIFKSLQNRQIGLPIKGFL